jgi:uncharacterized RmlC-like cupin family protein
MPHSDDVSAGCHPVHATIRVIRPEEFDSGTAQTSGALRQAAISPETNVASGMWGGIFTVEAGAQTGIHHHGEQETILYALEGSVYIRWGERGECAATVHAGEFLHIPAWLPHQESNPSKKEPFRCVVVRGTATPIVVNLPDDYWQSTTAAPSIRS